MHGKIDYVVHLLLVLTQVYAVAHGSAPLNWHPGLHISGHRVCICVFCSHNVHLDINIHWEQKDCRENNPYIQSTKAEDNIRSALWWIHWRL